MYYLKFKHLSIREFQWLISKDISEMYIICSVKTLECIWLRKYSYCANKIAVITHNFVSVVHFTFFVASRASIINQWIIKYSCFSWLYSVIMKFSRWDIYNQFVCLVCISVELSITLILFFDMDEFTIWGFWNFYLCIYYIISFINFCFWVRVLSELPVFPRIFVK